MVSSTTLLSDVLMSSVVPATATADDKVHEFSNIDLAMKLHYLRGLYFFDSSKVVDSNKDHNHNNNLLRQQQELVVEQLKKPMFAWLDRYYHVTGRIRRRGEKGRPYIKCNDCGVRIVEVDCDKTVAEVVAMDDHNLYERFVYNQVIGPDLGFSPLVFLQLTWFKCGGMAVGLSWPHVLGDVFSAAKFINMWGVIMAGHTPPESLAMPEFEISETRLSGSGYPLCAKRVDPVGDLWVTVNNCKMETHSFHLTAMQVDQLKKNVHAPAKIPPFEIIAAVVWKSLAKIRGGGEPKRVTICQRNSNSIIENEAPSSSQFLGTVEVGFEFLVAEAEVLNLAALIDEKKLDDKGLIEKQNGNEDFIVYGANLTFVDLKNANIFGLEIKGHKLVYANYTIGGVGDEGVVLLLPGREEGGEGWTLTLTLPEKELAELKIEIKREWGIA